MVRIGTRNLEAYQAILSVDKNKSYDISDPAYI